MDIAILIALVALVVGVAFYAFTEWVPTNTVTFPGGSNTDPGHEDVP